MTGTAGPPSTTALPPAVGRPLARETAPDGFAVEVLAAHAGASSARFILPAGATGRAVKHRQVVEIWTVLAGSGRLWRRLGAAEDVATLAVGTTVVIPADTCFQAAADRHAPLVIFACTTPPWPGENAARRVAGRWPPTLLDPLPDDPIRLRPATPDDCAVLTALARRSKAWWGYSEDFLAACAVELTVGEAMVPGTVVADCAGTPVGFASVLAANSAEASLELFFIEPGWMGRGIGRRLFRSACDTSAALGCERLLIEADPDAEAFYRACGAVLVGSRPSGSIPGRCLPLLTVDTRANG